LRPLSVLGLALVAVLVLSVRTAGREFPRPNDLTLDVKVGTLTRTVGNERVVTSSHSSRFGLGSEARGAMPGKQAPSRARGPFALPIPAGAKVDPNSDGYISALAETANSRGFILTFRRWSVPVYYATKSTPRHDVRLTAPWRTANVMLRVPIPARAAPDPSGDGHMTVLEYSKRCEFDFFRARKVSGRWYADWGNTLRTGRGGVYPHGLSTRGSGFSNLAGLIWPVELRAGEIKHALMFSYPYTSAVGAVAPATETDGQSTRDDALPEGARLQLDPSLDLRSLGLRPYERTIARALQRYGMYLGDTNSGGASVYAVSPQAYSSNPYSGLLPADTYPGLARIPIERFRVLRLGPTIPTSVLRSRARVVRTGCARMR
jgi:hypothetical protein